MKAPTLHGEDDHHGDDENRDQRARHCDGDCGDRLHVITIASATTARQGTATGRQGHRGAGCLRAI